MLDDDEKRDVLTTIDSVNSLTWLCTVAEVAFGAWLVLWMDWRLFGGVVIGMSIGIQLHRITRLVFGARIGGSLP